MTKHNLLFLIAGLLAGFIAGFIFANSANRTQTAQSSSSSTGSAQSAQAATANSNAQDSSQQMLEQQLRQAIQETDAHPDDIERQKKAGQALYIYVNKSRDPRFLPDVVRFLKRAADADPKDRNTLVSLGNALFDMGQMGEKARFAEARTYYQKALELEANDVNVRTDLGLTYYFGEPSDPASAIREYRKSLQMNPRHELTLQNLATALIKTGERGEAQKTIETLRSVNPQNAALADLETLLAQSPAK